MKTLIYCDPPYFNTTGYKTDFDHVEYYEWCRDKVKEGHIVLCSEYNMPDDFVIIYEKEIKSMGNKGSQKAKSNEKVFIHESQLDIYKRSFPDEV